MPSNPFIICHCGLMNLEKKSNEFFIVRRMSKYAPIKYKTGLVNSNSFYISANALKPRLLKKSWENSNWFSTNHTNSAEMKMPSLLGKAISTECDPMLETEGEGFTYTCMSLHLVHPYTCLSVHIHEHVPVVISSTNRGLLRPS